MTTVPDSNGGLPTADPAARPPPSTEHPFEFRGEANEYFRIWIVNLALSIVTLGVYSAWAKVRTQRYFYANTRLAGFPFEYQARPLPILKGRLIAFVLFSAYAIAAQITWKLQLTLAIAIALAAPWLVVRSLRFRARYSAWRSLNFRFVGDYGEAYVKYLLLLFIVPLTLGIFYPFLKAKQKRYLVDSMRFGSAPFRFTALDGDFFPTYLKAFGMILGWYVLSFGVLMALFMALPGPSHGRPHPPGWLPYVSAAVIYPGMVMVLVYVTARIANLVYQHIEVAGNRFRSTLSARRLIAIYATNTLAILVSAGMLVPWAMIRLARYRAQCLVLLDNGTLDRLQAAPAEDESATGAETGALFDIDIGF